MVGMLVADKTPLKQRKQTNLQNKKRKNERLVLGLRNDQTDSEEEESFLGHRYRYFFNSSQEITCRPNEKRTGKIQWLYFSEKTLQIRNHRHTKR